jgi:hypothetical protein
MDQTAMTQLQTALDYVSKDLDRVQDALTLYETQMLKSERVAPQLKEVVTYYRAQTTALRSEMLSLCELMAAYYRHLLLTMARADLPASPAATPTPVLCPVVPEQPEAVAPSCECPEQEEQEEMDAEVEPQNLP